ncbi:MAG: transporter substrate-binding domain-containing protein [Desulfovibrio sp.]|jgi:ABC-type amino acid transport substrate-binding protein|nr:transporter substrate-binding domain-containing protein [Desulfovibrio sp.]
MLRCQRIFFICLALCCIFNGWPAPAAALERQLKIGVERNYPPFSFMNKNNTLEGFSLEIAQAICEAVERNCVFVLQPLDVLQDSLKKGEIDVVMNVRALESMSEYARFSRPYVRTRSVYIGRPSAMRLNRPARIGVRKDGMHYYYLTAGEKPSATVFVKNGTNALLDDLVKGNVDMVLTNGLHAWYFLCSDEGREFDTLGPPLPPEATDANLRAAVRKNESALVEKLDKAIHDIYFNGVLLRINRKYFPYTLY